LPTGAACGGRALGSSMHVLRRTVTARPLTLALLASHLVCASAATVATARAGDPPELEHGDRVCLLGGALAERMQHHGWLETLLQVRFPGRELSVRNLGFAADELTVHQRMMNFGKLSKDDLTADVGSGGFVSWDRYLSHCEADVIFAFFGYNESFAGPAGLEGFEADLEAFVRHTRGRDYNGRSAPRLVLFSSIPFEDLGDPNLPAARAENARIEPYNRAAARVAASLDVPFVDLFAPMLARYEACDEPLTLNGIHLREEGDRVLADVIVSTLYPQGAFVRPDAERVDEIRRAVQEKNLLWFNRYRATDGYNVYGGRSREIYPRAAEEGVRRWSNFEVLQREMDVLDVLCANRDRRIQALAAGGELEIDDGNAPPLIAVETNRPGAGRAGAHVYLKGDAALDTIDTARGMRVGLYADEGRFPDLVNPVQMSWDTRGRLWVAVWPTYPHWAPGQPMNDKLLILEDVDRDGRADTCEVFAGDLHNPTGFELWNGGVLVASVPDLLFLRDTDGDDVADARERLLHGISSGDTHHSANSFVLGPDGALYFQEGTFHQTQIETVYGPVRNHDACVWRFEPRTWRVERYVPYDFANPHGHVFDRWGQDFVTDGTGNVNYYALPFSGSVAHPAKHGGYFPFFQQRSRPCAATEILSSRHFPPESQGNYLVANVIGFLGIFQYEVLDDGSGFAALERDPIVVGSDPNFRPSDIEIGPDGAIYFTDWHNALIGHLQHHLRDPSRDRTHGRVFRVTCEGRELLEPKPIAGQAIEALLELLKEPEDRVRYRARIELSARDSEEVVAAARAWVAELDQTDPELEHHLLEALWLHQQHDRVDRELLERLLAADDHRARAAATRVLRTMRRQLPGALDLLRERAGDEHPRVRLEAVVAASFFESAEAAEVALEALRRPTDRFLDYALAETIRALAPRWKEALREGRPLADGNPAGSEYLLDILGPRELAALPRTPAVLWAILTRHDVEAAERGRAASLLAQHDGVGTTEVLLDAIRRVDARGGAHATHVLHELNGPIQGAIDSSPPPRGDLLELARDGRLPMTRELAFAALIAEDREAAWSLASRSRAGLRAFLGGVPLIADPSRRAPLYERVRPLMFALPAGLARGDAGGAADGPGLCVSAYEPAPPDATLETFRGLASREQTVSPNFALDAPTARRSDSFGLLFEGTLTVAEEGEYTFSTRSDDGSRLYIGPRCVVDNDGAHGTLEKSGGIRLGPGRHPIAVTFFEQGGGDHLSVSWEGPGFEKQPIPDELLHESSGARSVRAAAIVAAGHVPGHERQKLDDAARFIGEGTFLDSAIELVRAIPAERRPGDLIRPVVDALAGYVSGLSAEERTAPAIAAALEIGRELADALPAQEAEAARRELAGLGGSIVLIRTIPHQMLYDVIEFQVAAGEPVAIVFQNNDLMPHNLVITRPGALEAVGRAAELLTGAEENPFIPATHDVLWHIPLRNPGQSGRLAFTAPDEPGDHPFVCTFPGHWTVMNGVMRVVDEVEHDAQVVRRAAEETVTVARDFVRDWKLEELAPLIGPDWTRERSLERGRDLFDELGCIKCHAFAGEAAKGGPELTGVGTKYADVDLLRQVVEPSADILEGYEYHYMRLYEGGSVVGRIVADEDEVLHLLENLQEPERVTIVPKAEIESSYQTPLSPMPTGLLVTLDEHEVLDLLAFLKSSRE